MANLLEQAKIQAQKAINFIEGKDGEGDTESAKPTPQAVSTLEPLTITNTEDARMPQDTSDRLDASELEDAFGSDSMDYRDRESYLGDNLNRQPQSRSEDSFVDKS